jgi:hypothetical protein
MKRPGRGTDQKSTTSRDVDHPLLRYEGRVLPMCDLKSSHRSISGRRRHVTIYTMNETRRFLI